MVKKSEDCNCELLRLLFLLLHVTSLESIKVERRPTMALMFIRVARRQIPGCVAIVSRRIFGDLYAICGDK